MDKLNDSLSANTNESQFKLTVQGQPDDTFKLLEYESDNYAISTDFCFRINTLSNDIITPEDLIGKKATLTNYRGADKYPIHGIITGMQYVRHLVDGEEHVLILKSPLTPLNHYRHNRIFLNKDIKTIIEEVLLDAGLTAADFRFKTRAQYPQYEFSAQYDESDLQFLQRLIAFHGIYYRFVFEPLKTIITFYDNSEDLPLMTGKSDLQYRVETGTVRSDETVYSMHLHCTLVTANIHLKDYNYRSPEAELQNYKSNTTDITGTGTEYRYGHHIPTLDAGEQLSTIIEQSLDCQRQFFILETDCRAIEPGTKLSITEHPDPNRNGDYLIIDVLAMCANQRAAILKNFSDNTSGKDGNKTKTYYATVKVIKMGVPYRSPFIEHPIIPGSFNAVVESTGGEYAYLDDQGRYRIRMGFDIGDAPVGEASHPVRLAQAYTGKDYGIHFPLHDKTEVVVSCINGDINRPIILGAVPNPDNHSPVTANNNSQNILRSFGGNELVMDDTIDSEKIDLFTRDKDISLSLDATKDNHKIRLATEQGKMELKAAKSMQVESEDSQFVKSGKDHEIYVENSQRLMTKNKEIRQTAKTDLTKKAGQNINWTSETGNTEINVGKDMVIEVENNCSYEVKNKDMRFTLKNGKFEVEAAKAITLKGDGGGNITFEQAGAKIEMDPAGNINIEGTTVNIDAGGIILKGGMMTHVPGGGGAGGGAGGGGGSGSSDYTQSKIEKYQEVIENIIEATTATKSTNNPGTAGNGTATPQNDNVCTNGCPISMVNGEELLEQTDFVLPGPLPLVWSRTYRTSHDNNIGLGVGWTSPWFAYLEVGADEVIYYDGEGRLIPFSRPDVADGCYNSAEKMTLYCDNENRYRIVASDKKVSKFAGNADIKKLIEVANQGSHAVKLQYNNANQLDTMFDSTGRQLKIAYNQLGLLHTVTLLDAKGVPKLPLVTYNHNASKDLISVTDAAFNVERFAYKNHVIVKRTTPDGFNFFFTWDKYDTNAKCLRNWGDKNIYNYRFEYNTEGKFTRSTDGRGNTTVYYYNDFGLITKEIDPEGSITLNEYSDKGELLLTMDPAGNTNKYSYTKNGKIESVTDVLGQKTSMQYDVNDNLIQLEDAEGQVWIREFDNLGRINSETDPKGSKTVYKYNKLGLPSKITNALGISQNLGWNKSGQLIAQSDGENEQAQYRYDLLGRITQVIDHKEQITKYSYDLVGNVIQVRHPDDSTIKMTYTAGGHLKTLTDALNRTTEFHYDGLSQPILRIDPMGRQLKYEYDQERNLTALINENGDRYKFEYDKSERLIKETGFDGRTQVYNYNKSGHLEQYFDGSHRETGFVRDALGRILEKKSSDGEVTKFAYDALGRIKKAINPISQLNFEYDAVGNLLAENQNGQKIEHRYDAMGQRKKTKLPNGQIIEFDFDSKGLFTKATIDGNTITNIERNQKGFETKRSMGALVSEREYDPMGRLISQRSGKDHIPVMARKYSYDIAGNLQEIDDLKKGRTIFNYDPLNRLKRVSGFQNEQFDFDPAGNIVDTDTQAQGGLVRGNRLTVFQDYRFEYDDVGNLIQEKKGGKTSNFTYNTQNQLIKVIKDGQQFEYKYDALGRRISKTDAFGETTFLWDGNTLISEERNLLQTTFIYDPKSFIPLCQVRKNNIYYYHNDHIGTPQALTDVRGEVVWQAQYKVYGNVVSFDVEEVENPIRFQGQYFDKETGLHYNRHRYYHPVIGRYTTVDPIGLTGGNNNYEYVPNPVKWVDPLGLTCSEYNVTPMLGHKDEHNPDNPNRWNARFGTVCQYLDANQRADYEVTVFANKLIYNSGPKEGYAVDTSTMNSLHSSNKPTAIFVMDPQGKIYVGSHTRMPGEFHHSSFLEGNPVASAGEITVIDGEIIEISNESGHYEPTQELNNQIFTELEKQGMSKDKTGEIIVSGYGTNPKTHQQIKNSKNSKKWKEGDQIPEDWMDL